MKNAHVPASPDAITARGMPSPRPSFRAVEFPVSDEPDPDPVVGVGEGLCKPVGAAAAADEPVGGAVVVDELALVVVLDSKLELELVLPGPMLLLPGLILPVVIRVLAELLGRLATTFPDASRKTPMPALQQLGLLLQHRLPSSQAVT